MFLELAAAFLLGDTFVVRDRTPRFTVNDKTAKTAAVVSYEYRYETRYDRRGRATQVRVLAPVRSTAPAPVRAGLPSLGDGGGCQIINGVRVCPVQR